MEPELLPGDNILVNKLTKGARLFNVLASLRGEDIAIYRMSGMGELNRNDVLVFNFPYGAERWDSIAFDVIQDYRFQENYYFMAGDKMLNSQDSRYWGLLPESFIVGKVWRIWKSVDPVTGKMRWNRFLKKVH